MRKHEWTTAGNQSSQLPESNKSSLLSSFCAQQDAAQVSQDCQLQSSGYFSSLLTSTDSLQNPQFWEDVLPSTSQPPRCEDTLPTRITREQLSTWTQVPLGNGARSRDPTQAGNIAVRASGLKISAFHHRLLLNGKVALDPYTLAVPNLTPQEPQNGFSISYGPNSNGYNSLEKIAGGIARDDTSIQLAPVTPNKYNGVQHGICLEEKRPEHTNDGGSFPMSLKGGELPPSNAWVSWLSSQLETQQHEQYRGQHVIDFRNLTSAPLAPVTPDKCRQLPDVPQPEIIDLVDDSETEENGIEVLHTNQPAKGQSLAILKHGTSIQEELPSCGIIQQPTQKLNQTGTELESRGIDLNKTPQQKPRKKKHRPKVIREGASARKGKQAAPKPAGTIETPPPKRKYTRRKESSATETPSSGGGESNNPAKKARKSAKRVLHFESEEIREEARNSSYELLSQKNHGSQDRFEGTRITNGCSQGPHVVETNLCKVSSDFDHSVKQVSNNHIASKETSLQVILAKRRAHLRENLNNLALLTNNINNSCNSQNSLPTKLLPSHDFILNNQTISNGCSNSQFIDNDVDFRSFPRIHSCGNNEIPTNYRNLIIENPQMKKICSDINNAKDKWLQSNGTEDNCGRGEGLQRNITDNIYLMLNKPRKENGGSDLASTGPSFLSSSYRNGEKLNVPQRPHVLNHDLNFNFNETERRQPPKAPTQVCNFSSLIGGISCGQLPSMSKVPHLQSQKVPVNTEAFLQTATPIKSTGMQEYNRQYPQIKMNPVNPELPCRNYDMVSSIGKDNPIGHRALSQKSHQQKTLEEESPIIIHFDRNDQRSLHVRAKTRKLAPDGDLLEIIIHKLKYLCISDGVLAVASQEPQSALVPYSGNGTIVPYEGPVDLSKKRKPRAKVDLDHETNRVWLLLMGKEGDLAAEGKDLDKEKYWEEERRVFRGRVDSFIARMHLVQGDRRFSPWKGSVVDSVVGVFLTQNVSDHLSSSAFMCMAAKFPVPYREFYEKTETKDFVKIEDDAVARQEMLNQPEATECPRSFDQQQNFEETKSLESGIFLERSANIGQSSCKSGSRDCLQKDRQFGVTSVENSMHTSFSLTESSLLAEEDETRTHDFAPSSHSVISSQNSSDSPIPTGDRAAIITDLNSEIDDPLAKSRWNSEPYPSFMEMLQMVGTGNFEELTYCHGGRVASRHNIDSKGRVEVSENRGLDIMPSSLDHLYNLNDNYPCTDERAFQFHPETNDYSGVSDRLSSQFRTQPNSTNEIVRDISSMPSFALDVTSTNHDRTSPKTSNNLAQNTIDVGCQRQVVASSSTSYISGLQKRNFSEPSASVSNSNTLPSSLRNQIQECATSNQQNDARAPRRKEAATVVTDQLPNYADSDHLVPLTCCDAKLPSVNPNGQCMSEKASNLASKNNGNNTLEAPRESRRQESKTRKGRVEKEKKVIDWDSLRRVNISSTTKKERSRDRVDSVDWEAVRRADVSEISSTIRERGMNNMLSERIKDFLDRLVREHGSIDLEWLRDVPPDQTKDYLLSIRGLGLKSVECVRLLTLHHLAFPVDTNVGRICVRLGWVPLQPLPESLQLHLLEMYPMLETIQKYLWPRLCKLDQKTLYELHYQMITFGKVFCTKSKPNCNACPMRGECKHFASAFASARLPLPGPEEKRLVSTEYPIASEPMSKPVIVPMPVAQLEGLPMSRSSATNNCEPIIEEPATPEPEYLESLETDIEEAFYEDPDEIPVIKLNIDQFTQNLHDIMLGNMGLLEGDMSKALVALTPEAASIPLPKLKNVNRLRTEHLVYELPDSHPLLEGWERREPDDPCPYLLAIWTPGETAQSTEPPDITCSSRENGDLCDKKTCFACNSIREAQSQKVRGTLLIPCRTAMRGSFPLNGTYFQVNELFADHSSSINPIEVPREWIWNLPRRTVYFGTSVPSIFKGLGTDPIQMCFWKGYICVRGFDRKTRFPRPLLARLHFPASKAMQNKRMSRKEDE